MKEKYCISVDWLQVCCYGNYLGLGKRNGACGVYEVALTQKHTAMFNRLYEVSLSGLVVATVQQEPRSSALKKGLTLVKIENRVLWSQKYIKILYDLMDTLRLTYKGITRIDLCYDCNKFFNGQSPARFIQNFVSKNTDEVGGMYLNNIEEFSLYGAKKSSSGCRFSGIEFGSAKSKVRPYIYNKTLELKVKKDKPWIREVWASNGLISTDKCPVWRTEISIKSQGTDVLNIGTGEIFRLSPNYLKHYDSLVKLFHFYAAKYLDFRINTGQKNRRHFKKLFLFDTGVDITCKPLSINRCADTGRMEKVCYNILDRLGRTYSDLAAPMVHSISATMNFLSHLSGVKAAITRANEHKKYLDALCCYTFREAIDREYEYAREALLQSKTLLRESFRPA